LQQLEVLGVDDGHRRRRRRRRRRRGDQEGVLAGEFSLTQSCGELLQTRVEEIGSSCQEVLVWED